jgi:hypothetical protein
MNPPPLHKLAISLAVLFVGLVGWGRPALASWGSPTAHELDPAEVQVDHTPPGAIPAASIERIKPGQGPKREGCFGSSGGSNDGLGYVMIVFTPPTDDRTPADKLGYLLKVSGEAPEFLWDYGANPIRADDPGELFLDWSDGATDDQESLDFTVEIIPVDLAGNQGPAFTLEVSDPGEGGCAIGWRGSNGALVVLVLTLCLLAAARTVSAVHRPAGADGSRRP